MVKGILQMSPFTYLIQSQYSTKCRAAKNSKLGRIKKEVVLALKCRIPKLESVISCPSPRKYLGPKSYNGYILVSHKTRSKVDV